MAPSARKPAACCWKPTPTGRSKLVPSLDAEVIVVGGGPVGLTLAAALGAQGIATLVLEGLPELPEDLRGSTFHPATLDMLEPLGVVEPMLARGVRVPNYQVRDRRSREIIADFDFSLLRDDTRHPYRLQCEQHKLSALLLERIARTASAEVRFANRYLSHTHHDDTIQVTVRTPQGECSLSAMWLVGADGIGSAVRRTAEIAFEGFTYPEKFLSVSTPYDFRSAIPNLALVTYLADPEEWCLLLRAPELWRVMFPIPPDEPDSTTLSDAAVERRLQGLHPRPQPYEVAHRTLYPVQQRVAASFRSGRVCLAGDAAHANNPLGGMGLNSGIHDAFALSDALARVLHDGAAPSLLDDYSRHRRRIALDHINAQAARNKRLLEERDPAARARVRAELTATAADPRKARDYLLRASLIASLREQH
ncbi:MAG: FAD-binding protein [Chloroflexi bacterium]|nr:MAG: FAD-binding protein [Chloroflexota bacterium]